MGLLLSLRTSIPATAQNTPFVRYNATRASINKTHGKENNRTIVDRRASKPGNCRDPSSSFFSSFPKIMSLTIVFSNSVAE